MEETNAPDRGRDLSAERIRDDPLGDTTTARVIIQCKHWLGKSVSIDEVTKLLAQVKLWEPPRVDLLVLVTSGRFTMDALDYIERFNQGDHAMRIEMWPNSHLEMLLARQPHYIAEFRLR